MASRMSAWLLAAACCGWCCKPAEQVARLPCRTLVNRPASLGALNPLRCAGFVEIMPVKCPRNENFAK
jgi:hypothetical protein